MHRIAGALAIFVAATTFGIAKEPAPPADATAVEPAVADSDIADAPEESPTVCTLIERSAAAHRLPVGFLTRLIWKESRFRSDAVSPKGAQGIAQFMPATAARRALDDPFDPLKAIPASALYLRDLADQFGNLGLAAAAYNAGESRVENWLAGKGGLPFETRDFVLTITGLTADEWTMDEAAAAATAKIAAPEEGCVELAAQLASPGAGNAPLMQFEQANWAPWGVQITGNFSLNRAMASYHRLQNAHGVLLAERPPMVVRGFNRSRGSAPFFSLRVPAETREEAGDMCRKLKAAGGACIVLKTTR